MDSTLSPTQGDPHHDGDVDRPAPKDWTGVEQALSTLAHDAARDTSERRSRTAGSDFSAGERVTEQSFDATLAPADLNNDPLPSNRPSLGRRALRSLARFLMTACIGVAATLAWQSYGGAAKQMLASWAPQLGWSSSLPAMKRPSGPEIAAEQPSPPANEAPAPGAAPAQAAAVAPGAPETVAPTAPVAPSPPELQQLKTMARDLAAVRQSTEQLAATQEQMARDIAKLKTTEQDIRHKVAAPPPRPAAAPAPKPVPMPPRPAPQSSAAPLPPALPESPSRPPTPVR
jgi:hypothetical protein